MFTQRFIQTCNKIPKVSSADIVSTFCSGVTDVRIREKLPIHDELTSPARIVELADM
jgi:hypothetical protein